VHRGRIVHAIAEEAHHVSHLLQCEDDALLLIWIDFDEEVGLLGGRPEGLVVEVIQISSGQQTIASQSDQPRDVLGDAPAVSCDQLDGNPERGESFDGFGRAVLWPIEEGEKSHERHVALVVPVVRRLLRHGSHGHSEHTNALFRPLVVTALEIGAQGRRHGGAITSERADLHHVMKRTLRHQLRPGRRAHDDRDALANEVERDLTQLARLREIGVRTAVIASSSGLLMPVSSAAFHAANSRTCCEGRPPASYAPSN
jgi:hypothetical protein